MKFLIYSFIISFSLLHTEIYPGPIKDVFKNYEGGFYRAGVIIEYHDDMTKAQAKQKALDDALRIILEKHCGVGVKVIDLSILSQTNQDEVNDHFQEYINTSTAGVIVYKETLESQLIGKGNYYKLIVKAKAKCMEGKKDPKFILTSDLNKTYFQEYEPMYIDIHSTKDCFYYIFNVLSDRTVTTWHPSDRMTYNFISKGEKISFPTNGTMKVTLRDNKDSDSEMMIVLAIKGNIKDEEFEFDFKNNTKNLSELMDFIVSYPQDEIVFDVNPFFIIKK